MKIMQFALAAALGLASTAAVAQPVPPPAPPPPVEVAPPAPAVTGWALEPGHYVWRPARGGWVWVHARWIAATPGYARFIPGHLNRFGVWIPGHWVAR